MTDMRSMRVLGTAGENRVDKFIGRNEPVRLDVPGGYVTFRWETSQSDLGYGYLAYTPLQAGLTKFRRA